MRYEDRRDEDYRFLAKRCLRFRHKEAKTADKKSINTWLTYRFEYSFWCKFFYMFPRRFAYVADHQFLTLNSVKN